MELQDRSRSPSRRTSRVEQVVGRWLRRSRDLGSRDRAAGDRTAAESSGSDQRNYPFRFNVQIQRDPDLNCHGLILSSQTPILVQEITAGGPADGRLVPGDQLVKINNVAVDDLTPEQAAEIIRECHDTLMMTVVRIIQGPKSSFITPEKRAKLRSNPVKVHFAEEVEVNGHSQGNSLLFLPNVLKVYLENGQTKAFKFEPSTTVKDIVMTLKEKLSLSRIEHFSLVLEQQHSSSKLLLLHRDERIQQVVQRKEVHDYRCLFRVCFLPKDLRTLLEDDPCTFEYLYLQGVNDVLQERYAVEMRCNTALRLAALHIQERLVSCGLSPKANLKTVTKTWGIENFVSSTLLRNMRDKDLKKAISYHMKKSQSLHDPKQKGLSVDQARINYLEELSDLKCFGGKSFSATMMLQDRESTVALLVGARYGVSQVVNHKLSILTTLTEFSSITRIELLPESDKVSLVKIYLQDIKPITLLLEATAAKDMSCLVAGYCRVFVDPELNVFLWTEDKKHRVSAEEGYVSRCASDSDDSSELDMEPLVNLTSRGNKPRLRSSSDSEGRKRKSRDRVRPKERGDILLEVKKLREAEADGGKETREDTLERDGAEAPIQLADDNSGKQVGQKLKVGDGEDEGAAEERLSEASDSCHTDSRILTSPSSDSLDALEEDDLITCSSSSTHPNTMAEPRGCVRSPFQLHLHHDGQAQPHLLAPPPAHSHPLIHLTAVSSRGGGSCRRSGARSTSCQSPDVQNHSGEPCSVDGSLCFAELSRLADLLPSPPEASEEDEEDELRRRENIQKEISLMEGSESREGGDYVFNFNQNDARCYYNLCSNITPDSARSPPQPQPQDEGEAREEEEKVVGGGAEELDPIPILQPPPGFGDSSSDEEFFDARDGFTSPEDPASGVVQRDVFSEMKLNSLSSLSPSDVRTVLMDPNEDGGAEENKTQEKRGGKETVFHFRKRSRKRRSFMETDFTSRVSYPEPDPESKHSLPENSPSESSRVQVLISDPETSEQTQNPSPMVSSLTHIEGEPAQLESKPILSKFSPHRPRSGSTSDQNQGLKSLSRSRKQEMEMEPDAMESKSVTDVAMAASPAITVIRCRVDPDGKESTDRIGDGKEEGEGHEEVGEDKEQQTGGFTNHMFLPDIIEEGGKEKEKEEERTGGDSSSLKRPLVSDERPEETNTSPECVTESTQEGGKDPLDSHRIDPQINTNMDKYFPLLCSPPPPPPSPVLPPKLPAHKFKSGRLVKTERNSNVETSNQMNVLNPKQESPLLGLDTSEQASETKLLTCVLPNVDDEEVIVVPKFIITASDEVTESSNSDNVFEDDDAETSCFLNDHSDDEKENKNVTTKCSTGDGSTKADKYESNISIQPLVNCEVQAKSHSVDADYTLAINSITAKLGAAMGVLSPSFNSGVRLQEASNQKPNLLSPEANKRLPGNNMIHNRSKELQPSAHFLFQACSPTIMGRLSASTLRGKIQNLPLYLSRSHESLNQTEFGGTVQSPAEDADVTKASNVHDVPQTVDIQMGEATESADSDDSDATVTESEMDIEVFSETTSAKIFSSGSEVKDEIHQQPVQTEPKPNSGPTSRCNDSTPGPITEPPASIITLLQNDTKGLKLDAPGPSLNAPELNIQVNSLQEDIPGYKLHDQSVLTQMVVTTQNLNGPKLAFHGQSQRTSTERPLMGLCRPSGQNYDPSRTPSAGCRVFTICGDSSHAKAPVDLRSTLPLKSEFSCGSTLTSGCESVTESIQVPLDACGCPTVYSNCFSGEDNFDEELTVFEFSCRSQNSGLTQTSGAGLHLITSPPIPSFSSPLPPPCSRPIFFSSSTSELSPLLSPQSNMSYMSQKHKDTISCLGQQCYPEPPVGFKVLCRDVDKLLCILEGGGVDRSVIRHGGRHPRNTCPAHFTENKRLLQLEARRLMTGCQQVVGIGQSPQEMLHSLANSFRTLVELASICLWFSGCDRCDQRNAEAVAGLVDVARSFRDFCLAAERASSNRSCQDLSTKLLAKQCTALTASVFCLTQLFRTLTSL
ncbi:FERM and PDZ domain-containing protein 1 [Nematolebias whitei]|uniref:FERM and PDZ domain-containing protein 1 n=1 Tax=Nematolebias whitei TaxID=451745 RepID=UPI0018988EA5|nr:FERM and PDZ domain-containing protein 1 [Nematolebias whitei]